MTFIKHQDLFPSSFSNVLDKIFNETLSNAKVNRFIPSADVIETDTQYEIYLSLPGMKKEDFKLDIEDHKIVVSGERKFEREDKRKNFHVVETQYGSFARSFNIPKNVKHDEIKATYADGILNLIMPKDEKKEGKKSIQVD